MNDTLLQFARWLEAQPGSVGLHESFYLYNWIETTHVLTLMVALGALVIIDLRMLGLAFTNVRASVLAARLGKPMWIGFAIMFATGIALYGAIPVRTTQSLWFRIKLVLILVAGINALLFHRYLTSSGPAWDAAQKPPQRARIAAGVSLAIWACVVIAGRFIAYDWFDCGEANPAWIDWAIGCMQPHGSIASM